MRAHLLLIPDVDLATDASPLRQDLPALEALRAGGRLRRVQIANPHGIEPGQFVPEAAWLGMRGEEGQMAPGPLMVSSLRADPPGRSTQFVVTPARREGDGIAELSHALTEADANALLTIVGRLNTPKWTFLAGISPEFALVQEEVHGYVCAAPGDWPGRTWAELMPDGDRVHELRRWIDDAANLLLDCEFNRARVGNGQAPIDALMPWGNGFRLPTPKLSLRRGQPAWVYSESWRLAGLTRLVGYRHIGRGMFRSGLQTKFDTFARQTLEKPTTLSVFAPPPAGLAEESQWWWATWDREFLAPFCARLLGQPARLLVIVMSGNEGLVLESGLGDRTAVPIGPDAMAAPLPRVDLADVAEDALRAHDAT
ncbi:MAG: hypothetical protein SFX74_07675 [Fimbriimonadaceae bacterium]|nr:hypothetical protein [Fimbriimonadaceae bacterium]